MTTGVDVLRCPSPSRASPSAPSPRGLRLGLGLALLVVVVAATARAEPPLPEVPTMHHRSLDAEAAYLATRKPVSLKEALALTAKGSMDLAQARAGAEQVAAKARMVYSAILPELSLTASYVRTSTEQKFDIGSFAPAFEGVIAAAINGAGPAYGLPGAANQAVVGSVAKAYSDQLVASAPPTIIVAKESLYGTLLVQQVLFTPQFFLLPAAADAKEAARFGVAEAREQVLLGVARLYLGIEGLAQLEQAAKDAEEVARKRERDAQAQASIGMTTDIAVLRAKTETAQARALLATLSGQRVGLLALLEALVGSPVRPLDAAPTRVEVTAGAEGDRPWERTALLKSDAYGVMVQERFSTFDRLSWMPTVLIQGKGSYNSNKGFANTNFIFDGIVAAQWTLYDRGQRYATMHENDAKLVEARAKLDGHRARAKATWLGAKANLEAAEVALLEAEAQAALAGRAQRQVESAYRAGFSTSLEVSDIDSKRFLAASAAANARAQLEIRKVELAAAEGRLAEVMGVPAQEE
jgi:outer membrane protein TolC